MNILVTGADGQLGQEIRRAVNNLGLHGSPGHTTADDNYYMFAGRKELDITNHDAVCRFITSNYINVIINCAAYTDVNKAETDGEGRAVAFKVNADGAKNLADAAKLNGAVLIHVSTDYVFGGDYNQPIETDEVPHPLNVYGMSKYEGERDIVESGCAYLIFRVSWLYSATGKNNFVHKIIDKLLNDKDSLEVVTDEISTPTSATAFADFIVNKLIESNCNYNFLSRKGIYHYTDGGVASRFDFAYAISAAMIEMGLSISAPGAVKNCKSKSPVKRPNYSVLDTTTTDMIFGLPSNRHWSNRIKDVVSDIIENFNSNGKHYIE